MPEIPFEDFTKVELAIGEILSAERVEGSEKLLRFEISLGEEKCQILSGIGRRYDPATLVGKKVALVKNLAPRSIMGFESKGMILAADSAEGPALLFPDGDVASGTVIK